MGSFTHAAFEERFSHSAVARLGGLPIICSSVCAVVKMSKKRTCNFEPIDLIDAVEMRPCIWDKRIDEYKDKISRDKAWIEICSILEPNFNQMEHGEKKKFGKLIYY